MNNKIIRCGWIFVTATAVLFLLQSAHIHAAHGLSCSKYIDPNDALLVVNSSGKIIYKQNETRKYVPASTLKVVTALATIRHFSLSYRFRTEFYMDANNNLKIKGYGDPLLMSEVWQEIAETLSTKIQRFESLVLDDTYFLPDIQIPGKGLSTNPYDAPQGALCANFNTVAFAYDLQGRIISTEPQTPMTPIAREKIKQLKAKKGRYTFSHIGGDATRYAGELFLDQIHKKGVRSRGDIALGLIAPTDRLIYTYESRFTLDEVIQKMMEFSSNFMANQLCIALGARVYGAPGTLEKGVRAINGYVRDELGIKDIHIVEGSGISRENRISALAMKTVLERFRPYNGLLKKENNIRFKTGTLKGVRTRVGFIDDPSGSWYYFVIFLNHKDANMDSLTQCISKACTH